MFRRSILKKVTSLIILAIINISTVLADEKPAITLVDSGQTKVTIIIGKKAGSTEKQASKELQLFLKKITGATVPIKTEGNAEVNGKSIVIGTPATCKLIAEKQTSFKIKEAGLGRDGLMINCSGNGLYLIGQNPPGALYAAYALLEDHLGVRWYFPGELGEYVAKSKSIKLPQINDIQKPSIQFRGMHAVAGGGGVKNKVGSDALKLWMSRNKMNNQGITFTKSYEKRDVQLMKAQGHYLSTQTHFSHWLNGHSHYEDHPEFFPLLKGKRVANRPSGYNKNHFEYHNYCLSNKEMVNVVAKSMRKFLEMFPETEVLGINQEDSSDWCECEPCKEIGAPTDRLHTFVNRLADELGPVLDNRYLATQAYQQTGRPPVKVKPHDKVLIYYALITQCSKHTWGESCSKLSNLSKELTQWLRHKNKVIAYTYHANLFTGYPIPLAFHTLGSMKFYDKIGVSGWHPEISSDNPGGRPLGRDKRLLWGDEFYSKKLAYYTATKGLWNSKVNLKDIKQDFFKNFYGHAGPAMRKYYEGLEAAWRDTQKVRYKDIRLYNYNPSMGVDFLNPDILEELKKNINKAQDLAKSGTETIQKRVQRDYEFFQKWEERFKDTGGISTVR